MTNPKSLEPGPDAPHVVRVLVEVPKGSRNKYEVDPATGAILLDRYLFASSHYPGDYGFVPGTLAEDADPRGIVQASIEASRAGGGRE